MDDDDGAGQQRWTTADLKTEIVGPAARASTTAM